MWRKRYARYYCNECERYFYVKIIEDEYDSESRVYESPLIMCPTCGSLDTEPYPFSDDESESNSIWN